jgi:hypothetical protein
VRNLIVCFFRRRADSNEAVRSIVGTAKFQSMFRRNVDGTWSLVLLNKGAATMTSITKILLGATAGAANNRLGGDRVQRQHVLACA